MRSQNVTRTERSKGRRKPSNRAFERLRAQTQALRSTLEHLADGVVIADLEGRFLLFNAAAERILGVGLTEARPEGWAQTYGLFLPDGVTPYPTDRLPLALAIRGQTLTEVEIFVRNPAMPDGAWISVNASPWRDDEGGIRGGIAVFRDITVHKRAHESERRLSNAVEQTADIVVITDSAGGILYVNPAFEQTTGYSRDEALGQTPRLLRSGKQDPAVYAQMWATLLAGGVFRGTIVNRKKSGEMFHAEQTITPMKDGAGNITHFVSVGKDITELRRAAETEIELRVAHRVQQKLYPRSAPRIAGADIAGAVYPSSLMCGDYFDFVRMPGEQLGIVIGDVSGHGLGPALVMAETRAYLRSSMQTHSDPDEILCRVNETLVQDLERNLFVTMLLVNLDVGARSLTYANAGHPSGYVLDRSGEVRLTLESTRVLLGVGADFRGVPARSIPLEPGDLLLLVTDGILESQAPDGAFFGEENTLALVRNHRHEPAARILESLYLGARAFTQGEPQADDLAAVICKLDPEP